MGCAHIVLRERTLVPAREAQTGSALSTLHVWDPGEYPRLANGHFADSGSKGTRPCVPRLRMPRSARGDGSLRATPFVLMRVPAGYTRKCG